LKTLGFQGFFFFIPCHKNSPKTQKGQQKVNRRSTKVNKSTEILLDSGMGKG